MKADWGMKLAPSKVLADGTRIQNGRGSERRMIWLLLTGLACYCAPLAQTSRQSALSQSASGLEVLSFGFESKSFLHMQPTGSTMSAGGIPKGGEPYRAEFGWPVGRQRTLPESRQQAHETLERQYYRLQGKYYSYETNEIQHKYAVALVRNDSARTVKSVDWEFTYPHFTGNKEIVYYRARTRLKISPGQVTSLIQQLPYDGCGTAHLISLFHGKRSILRDCGNGAKAKITGPYPLEARIKGVKYTDGTAWQAGP